MGFRLGPGGSIARTAAAPWRWSLVAVVLVTGVLLGWFAARGLFGSPVTSTLNDLAIDPRPVITSLQQIGELHTVKMNMKDVLHVATDRPAEGWLREIPGSDTVSKWATHNDALVVAVGSVDAGIDLKRISANDVSPVRLPDGTQGLRVRLPQPTVYTPNITVTVEKSDSGLLWKDENLIPKAEAEASRRFLDAADKDGIRQHAEENALDQLHKMHSLLGQKNIDFYF